MIRLGRYDIFEKWEIVCRAWAGTPTDVGRNRRVDRPSLQDWQTEAWAGGSRYLYDYLIQKADAAAGEGGAPADAVSRLAREKGVFSLWKRVEPLLQSMKASGFAEPPKDADLPKAVIDRLVEAFRHGALQALRWTDDKGEIPGLEELRGWNRPYPTAAIKYKRKVLAMFCAEWYGVLDVIHIHDAAPDHVTLLDFNPDYMEGMKRIYPPEWEYACADYKEFLRDAESRGLTYDLITADPWAGMCQQVAFDMIPTIMGRCTDTLVIHYLQEMFDELGATPDDLPALSRAITQRTGVAVEATAWVARGRDNGYLVMRKR